MSRWVVIALAVAIAIGRPASAQDAMAGDGAPARGPIVGLLNLPEIVGEGCGASPPATADLRAEPSTGAPLIGRLAMRATNPTPDRTACAGASVVMQHADGHVEELPFRESAYEVPAAVVRAERGNWYRIDLARGSAWIQRPDARHVERYPELLLNDRLTYLDRWDATLWRTPGGGMPIQAPAVWRQAAWDQYRNESVIVGVLAVRRVGGRTWLQVRLVPNPCGDEPAPISPWTGWLPAHTRTGHPSVWFYSRGC